MSNVSLLNNSSDHLIKFSENGSYIRLILYVVIIIAFVVGALANIAVLYILHKSSKSGNKRYVFMLKCLAANDFVAQCGMLLLVCLNKYQIVPTHFKCVLFVFLRGFGVGSGCIALVMAIERLLALTKPFLYQRHVTHNMVRRCTGILWGGAIFITYFPLFGFGQYYNNENCSRYREASLIKDIIYAYIFFMFGTTIIVGIISCNLRIIYELWKIQNGQRIVQSERKNPARGPRHESLEEVFFGRLMIILCILYIVCWIPQMVAIPMAQLMRGSKPYKVVAQVADPLLAIYFALDPYVYVLGRYIKINFCRKLCKKPATRDFKNTSVDIQMKAIQSSHKRSPRILSEDK
ncbi:hypothetical protein RI129_012040 [Pyrocoelia pectoralis]|uniref:G-protein coupled receptors family 1 profile domain-containing protein n=1 Tax=Pyrocoelia pectoralis TaxID=417401 RepID=A0AAN7ZHU0_9COLE